MTEQQQSNEGTPTTCEFRLPTGARRRGWADVSLGTFQAVGIVRSSQRPRRAGTWGAGPSEDSMAPTRFWRQAHARDCGRSVDCQTTRQETWERLLAVGFNVGRGNVTSATIP